MNLQTVLVGCNFCSSIVINLSVPYSQELCIKSRDSCEALVMKMNGIK